MKLSTILTSLLLFAATFLLYAAQPGPGLFADEQPARIQPECPEQLQAAGLADLRAPGAHELDQPLGRLGLGLASRIGSQDARGTSAQSWHRWSALLHGLTCLLLYWILSNLGGSRTLALLGALLFGLHPLLVESVTWASQSARLLSGVWMLLGLGFWSQAKTPLRLLALPSALLALLSHPVAMPMGILMLLIQSGRQHGRASERVLALLVSLLGVLWLFFASAQAGASIGWLSRVSSAPMGALLHLRQALAPRATGDIILHPSLDQSHGSFVLAGWALCLLLSTCGIWLMRGKQDGQRNMGLGLLWFLSCSLGAALVPYGETIGADSDAYLALPGLLLFGLGAICYGLRKVAQVPRALSLGLLLLALGLGNLSVKEIEFRRSELDVLLRALDSQRSFQEHGINFVGHRRLGLELLWHGDLTSADAHLKHALDLAPLDAAALVGRARVAMQRDEKQKARALLLEATKADPRSAKAWERLAELNLRIATQESNREAIECLEQAIALDPGFAHAHARLASLLSIQYGEQQKQQLTRAMQAAQSALDLDPESKEAWKSLAATRARQGDFDGAIQAYEMSLAIEADYSEALAGLGALLQTTGAGERSLPILERSYYLHPLDPSHAFELASAYADAQDYAQAEELFRVTLSINQRHMRAREGLGWILLNRGDVQAAIQEGERMLDVRTSHPGARRLLAQAYQQSGRFGEAIICLKIVISDGAASHETQANLALLLAASPVDADRDGERALKLAQAAVRGSQANHVPSLRALAAAQAELGDFRGALATIKKAFATQTAELKSRLDADAKLYAARRPLRLVP